MSRLPDALTWAEKEQTRAALRSIDPGGYLEPIKRPKRHDKPKKRWNRPFAEETKARKLETTAREIERTRQKPYRVVSECHGVTITFGESDTPDGGMALNMARLVWWAKNPRVESA